MNLLRPFLWGPPSRKRIAWIGTAAGVLVVGVPIVIAVFGRSGPLLLGALLFTGLGETGWVAELLPADSTTVAGLVRLLRWLFSGVGTVLAMLALILESAPFWFAGVVAAGGLLLVFEMAPGGPANRP